MSRTTAPIKIAQKQQTKEVASLETETAGAHLSGPMIPSPKNSQEFNSIITKLFISKQEKTMSVAICSALSGEGVTTISANLAAILASQVQEKVLLVEANLYSPQVHTHFRVPRTPGLAQVLEQTEGLESTIHKIVLPNLFILQSGGPRENGSLLIGSKQMEELVSKLKQKFSYLIFDTAPVLKSVDAAMLGQQVDAVALVVRAGLTPRDQVVKAKESLVNCNMGGVILNSV